MRDNEVVPLIGRQRKQTTQSNPPEEAKTFVATKISSEALRSVTSLRLERQRCLSIQHEHTST
jgi:hypothetical protein